MPESDHILLQYTRLPDNLFALLSRYHVVIPGIQRHYVQGADTPRAKAVRINFIEALFTACNRKENKSIHLHFVYGPIDSNGEDTFTPVDGQQRLTTLWLLARYAAEYLAPKKKADVLQLLSRFSYSDRIHATRFCRALTKNGCSWEKDEDPLPSILLQDWFWDYWMQDETVSSMLRMFSTIHEKWKEFAIDAETLLKFIGEEATFSLQIDHFADNIYMKMNTRGLQLTQWENFKGKFAELLSSKEDKEDGEESIRSRWNQKIEQLSNTYFNLSGKQLPDNAFFALIARLIVYESILSKSEEAQPICEQIKELAFFTQWDKDLPYVPFDEFVKVFPEERRDSFITNYLELLDFVLKDDLAKMPSPYWKTARTLLRSVFEPKNQNELDLSWLLFAYCRCNKNIMNEDFEKALRCTWNILENVNRDKPFERIRFFESSLIKKCGPSLYGQCETFPDNNIAIQWKEERAKAEIYNSKNDNVALLQSAEKNMHGRVRLGILDLQNNNPSFSAERLAKLNELFRYWNEEKNDSKRQKRKNIVLNIVAAEPYKLMDAISLSTKDDDNLLKLLTPRHDKSLQNQLLSIESDKIPESPFEAPNSNLEPWERDWRTSILSIAGANNLSLSLENGTVRYHSTGIYALYVGSTIRNALPINDWRIEIELDGKLKEWYNKLGESFQDIRANDGETHSGEIARQNGEKSRIYFWADQITWSPDHQVICGSDDIKDLSCVPQKVRQWMQKV